MEWKDLLAALSLVFVIEGLLPFMAPERYKEAMQQMSNLPEDAVRKIGIGSIFIGVVLLYLVRS